MDFGFGVNFGIDTFNKSRLLEVNICDHYCDFSYKILHKFT